jgi:hypothetical protein
MDYTKWHDVIISEEEEKNDKNGVYGSSYVIKVKDIIKGYIEKASEEINKNQPNDDNDDELDEESSYFADEDLY